VKPVNFLVPAIFHQAFAEPEAGQAPTGKQYHQACGKVDDAEAKNYAYRR
jgi:hypothetical protein